MEEAGKQSVKVRWAFYIGMIYIPLGLVALINLILLWGWNSSDLRMDMQIWVTRILLGGFVVTEVARASLTWRRWSYLRANWLELLLTLAAFFILVFEGFISNEIQQVWHPHNMGTVPLVYMSLAMLVALASFFLRSVLPQLSVLSRKVSPERLFIASFAMMILVGTLLLKLPRATPDGISWLDALFTSTSSVCVTGLIVLDTATQFTHFGHCILLLLMQVGGLGIMTLTYVIAVMLSREISMKEQIILSDYLNEDNYSRVHTLLKLIIRTVALFEFLGAIAIYFTLPSSLGTVSDRIFLSVFHSVSAFCNAGFSVFPNGLATQSIAQNNGLQFSVIILIVFGGLGFFVLREIGLHIRATVIRQYRVKRWSLHTKIVIWMSGILIFVGAFFIALSNCLNGQPLDLMAALFQSVSARTAGFNTVDMGLLSHGAVVTLVFLMFVGGSPGGTAGGIKTTVIGVAVINLWHYLRGRDQVQIFNRRISPENSRRTFAILTLSMLIVFCVWLMLCMTHPQLNSLDLGFETVSAFSTVGLTRNLTPELNTFGRLLIILTMFIGRIGILYFAVALFSGRESHQILCPKEHILLG